MIVFKSTLVLIPIFKAEEKIIGGPVAVRNSFQQFKIQEDEYLIGIAVNNATEVREVFEQLLELGLSYNDQTDSSEDFTVWAKEGLWWPAAWLVNNDEGCWFIADVEAPDQ
jgi:hypothetical protein